MRLAIVSDIHGNLTALEAVIEDIERRGVERVVHGGDLALTGCQPAEVVDRLRELGWPGVLGNTDELLWRPEEYAVQRQRAPKLGDLLRALFEEYAPATRALLGEERIGWLRALPSEWREDELTLVHASPGDLWRALCRMPTTHSSSRPTDPAAQASSSTGTSMSPSFAGSAI